MVEGALPPVRIETARLILRTAEESDVDALFALRAHPEVSRHLGPTPSREEVLRLVRERRQRWSGREGQALGLAVELKPGGLIVGEGVLRYVSEAARQAEMGAALHPDHAGRALGTEACVALLGYAFDRLGMHRVFSVLDVDNQPSVRLTRRIHLRLEGTLRENALRRGEWRDEQIVSMLDREWQALRPSFARYLE